MNNRGGQGEIYEHVGTYEQKGDIWTNGGYMNKWGGEMKRK